MIVAGLDLSLNGTGIVIARDGGDAFEVLVEQVLNPGKRKGMERICWVMSTVRRALAEHLVEDLAIEGYAFAKLTTHAHAQGELGGVVRLALWQRGLSWWEVPPASLKKFVTGKGNAPKEVMLREVFKRWEYEAKDNNLADAYALARGVGAHHHGFWRKTDQEAWSRAERVEGRASGRDPLIQINVNQRWPIARRGRR